MRNPFHWVCVALLLAVAACGDVVPGVELQPPVDTDEYGEEMSLTKLNPAGLYTSPSALSSVPEGALLKADNVVLGRPGLLETRRGMERLAGAFPHAGGVKSWVPFAGGIVGWGGGVLASLNTTTGVWTAYSGTYNAPPGATRVQFAESALCLFFTTSTGVYRLDTLTSTPVAAGVPQALDGKATLTGASGILGVNRAAASRYVWGTRDAHGRLMLGAPSGRVIATNAGAASANIQHVIPIPDGITANHFVQVYRSADVDIAATPTATPSDEMRQVLEVFPTDDDLSGKSITVVDVDPIRAGPTLYTSPNLGDGILAAKYVPPVCTSIAEWQGRLFCAATTQRQRVLLTLLSVDAASGGMADNDVIQLTTAGVDEKFRAGAAENPTFGVFQRYTSGSAGQNTENTARSLVRIINMHSSVYRAYYASGDNDIQVKILLEARTLGALPFTVSGIWGGPFWSPAISWGFESEGISRVGTIVTVTTTTRHSLKVNQTVDMRNNPTVPQFPGGLKTVKTVPSPTTFTYDEGGPTVSLPMQGFTWFTVYPSVESDPTASLNGFAYSPIGEPDAIPLPDYEVVGNADKAVLAILPLSNALFLLKEDGLYRVTGDSPETLVIEPWDTTLHFIAPDAATVIDGQAFALADEGLVTWTESSRPRPASVPVESALRFLSETAPGTVRNTAFIAPYDSDRRLLLWMPANDASTSAEQAFVLNLLTGTWTRWTVPAVTALVNPADGKLYVTPPTGNTQRERKTGTSADYQGPDGEAIPVDVQWVAENAGAPHMGKLWGIVEYFFGNAVPSEATAYFSTEVVPATQSTPTYANNGSRPGVIEAVVTPNHARAAGLSIGFQHSVAQEKVELQGYGIRFRMYQGRR